jgi:YHS domain-containing protein
VLLVILRIILFLVVIRAIWMLAKGILEGAGYQRIDQTAPSVKLVRDPVCGMFVAPTHALTAGSGRDTAYFCSEKCRSAWQRR